MRTRMVRPEFWSDPTMGSLPALVRLTYVGTWCLADDAGYLNWDRAAIASELYRYQPVGARERQVADHLERLVKAGRIKVLGCREHAVIPTIPDHRMKGGEQLFTIKKQHDKRCSEDTSGELRSPTQDLRDEELRSPTSSVSVSGSGSGSDSLHTPRAKPAAANGHPDDTIHDVVHRLTGAYLAPSSKNGDRVTRWVEKLGRERVDRELRETADDLGGLPMTNQLLNSTEDRLFPALTSKPKPVGVTKRAEHSLSDEEVNRAFQR